MNNLFSKRAWIEDKVRKGISIDNIYKMFTQFNSDNNCSWYLDSFKRTVRRCVADFKDNIDIEVPEEDLIKLEAQKQRLLDINNSVRKTNRESYRLYNSLEEIFSEYVDVMNSVDLTKFKIKEHVTDTKSKIGIMQLSDHHLNEIIYESESFGNSFNFDIASKRLKKFVTESISYFKYAKVNDVYIFFTGDLINSSRRLSERLAQNSSLVRASLLATYLYKQVIIELSKYFNIHVASVVGNESRLDEDMESSDLLSSENWDYLIFNNLRLIFTGTKVEFINSKNNIQSYVQLKNGYNALLLHGHTFKSGSIEKQVGSLLQNYSHRNITIHGVFYGHYHSASISDYINRSSSLCGGNSYSTNDLMFMSRASQNIYIVSEDHSVNAIKIDLQNCSNEGYDILEELENYNVRNFSNNKVTIENLV